MIILGFDPGLATLGYGIINTDGHKHRAVDFGIISTPAGMSTPVRLRNLYNDVCWVIDKFSPQKWTNYTNIRLCR